MKTKIKETLKERHARIIKYRETVGAEFESKKAGLMPFSVKDCNIQYFINEEQEVYSVKGRLIRRISVQKRKKDDYMYFITTRETRKDNGAKKVKVVLIHRAMMAAFHCNGNYEFEGVVNHMDVNPSNNYLSNLEIVTQSENLCYKRCEYDPFHYTFVTKNGKYNTVKVKGEYLGSYDSPEAASRIAKQYFLINGLPLPKHAKFAE